MFLSFSYIAPDKALFVAKKVDIFVISRHNIYVVGSHTKCISEALLMSTHNICFGEIYVYVEK